MSPRPIILSTFGRVDSTATYRWPVIFSIVLHVTLIGLTLWLSHRVLVHRAEPVAVLFHRPPPPRPPPQPEVKQEAPRKGARGVNLPKAVAPDVQPEFELTFAASPEPPTATTGKWVGGVGTGAATGPGWSNGVEGGAIIRRSRARDPQELDSGWPCNWPPGEDPAFRPVVRIRVHVDVSGRPTQVTIVKAGPPAFNTSAIECAMEQRFRPALDITGTPCEGDREVGILFIPAGKHLEVPFAQPPPPPRPPPMAGPQPDLPIQLDDSPVAEEKPPG